MTITIPDTIGSAWMLVFAFILAAIVCYYESWRNEFYEMICVFFIIASMFAAIVAANQ